MDKFRVLACIGLVANIDYFFKKETDKLIRFKSFLSNNPDAAISKELFEKFEPTGCKPIYHCEEAANLMTDDVKTSRDLSEIEQKGEIKIAYKHEDLVCLGSGKIILTPPLS